MDSSACGSGPYARKPLRRRAFPGLCGLLAGLFLALALGWEGAHGASSEQGEIRIFDWLRRLVPAWSGATPHREPPPAWRLSDLLAGSAEGFERVAGPRRFEFPADHGPHEAFRTEWWYFTGHLRAAAAAGRSAREFGYQLAFFRFGLVPPGAAIADSPWAARNVYMAHFALTDPGRGAFEAHERLGRGALGIAGATAERVWIDDWSLVGPAWPIVLRATAPAHSIELRVDAGKPIVAQGEGGYSRKSATGASYYYSATRLPTRGRVRVSGVEYEVTGESWWDREWGSDTLGPEQIGWDWFAIQLADGRELMVYQLRRSGGAVDPHSAGTWVRADGSFEALAAGEFTIEVLERWTSPRTGTVYPAKWRIRVPKLETDLELAPRLPDQELVLSIRYWEGAVSVSGRVKGKPVTGLGYAELTGYANAEPPAR